MGDVVRLPMLRERSHPRPKTESMRRVRQDDLALERSIADLRLESIGNPRRPKTRGECEHAERPCPWVSCRHHLYLEVNRRNGSIKFVFPDLEPDELTHSCSLDLADDGPHTLDMLGEALNFTRERVRQLEDIALRAYQRAATLAIRKDDR